jgi:hypothetical protein
VARFFLRWFRRVVVVVLSIELGYIVLANVVLAAGAIKTNAPSDADVRVKYKVAWSFWPGVVHVQGFRMVMQDRNVQFVLDIATAKVHVSLREVFHRTFHATKVRADGVVFRFRQRIDPLDADQPWVRALPHIPGLPDPPLRVSGPPEPPLDDAHYNLWTVHLEDVDAGVREVWFDMFRYQGEARATGAFRLIPARRVWVGPAELVLKSGGITTAANDLVNGVGGAVDCTVEDFDVNAVEGVDALHYISARIRLAGQVAGLEPINFLYGRKRKFNFRDGQGSLDADVALDHGSFTPDTRLAFVTRRLSAEIEGFKFHVDGDADIQVHGPSGGLPGRLSARTAEGSLGLEAGRSPPARIRDAEASVSTTTVDLTKRWAVEAGRVEVGEITIPDLRWLNDLPQAHSWSWSAQGGKAIGRGTLTFSRDHHAAGWATMRLEQAVVRDAGTELRVDADAQGTFTADREGLLRGFASAEARRVRWGQLGSGSCPLAEAESISLTAHAIREERRAPMRELRATMQGGSFHWGDFEGAVQRTAVRGQWHPGWMQARIDVDGLQMINAGGPPRSWRAFLPATSVDMVLTSDNAQTGGRVRVESKRVGGQVGSTKVGGDVIAQLAVVTPGGPGTADASGTVLARNVSLRRGVQRVDDWWAQVNLQHAAFDTTRNFDLTARAEARVQNGLPVLYLLSSENESPGWLLRQLARTTFTVGLDVRRFCRWTDVQIPQIEGGLLFAQGRVQAEPGQTSGAMLFRLAPLRAVSVGMVFYEDHSDTAALVGAEWLERQIVPMSQAADAKGEASCPAQPATCH